MTTIVARPVLTLAPPAPVVAPLAATTALLEAQRLIQQGEYGNASTLLRGPASAEPLARPLLLDCLGHLDDMGGIVTQFDPPESATEAIYLTYIAS